jgi:hypothetical protein
LRIFLVIGLIASALVTLGYLFYNTYGLAQVIDTANGLGMTQGEIAVMHLAVRATPAGSEALGFAVLMAVRNFFMWGSDWLGSAMLESVHMSFGLLEYISAGTTLLAVPLALMLSRALVNNRDND